ncbi:IS1096 element passenger TnpR family protein [Kitasatospora indigofera]|uniref:IS1096 element passenger TnpR family protein n=1 Tax=Kitasatospora indigofera TaxID=67307 RepID=UPI0033BCE0BA
MPNQELGWGVAEPGITYPRCLRGRRACSPENCGGVWGCEDLLRILAGPADDEHEERLEWLGLYSTDQFDPVTFDLAAVNAAALADLAKAPAKARP